MSPKFILLYSSTCTVAKWYSSELKINVLKKKSKLDAKNGPCHKNTYVFAICISSKTERLISLDVRTLNPKMKFVW